MIDYDPIINNTNINSGYDAQYNAKTCNRIAGALEFVDSMGSNDNHLKQLKK